jgi:hypothetical protein
MENKFEQYSDQWRSEMRRLRKSELLNMVEWVMRERDALMAASKSLLSDIESGCAEVMVGEHKGRGYGSNNHYRELVKLTGYKSPTT